ncbi:MAG: hypothetical protein HOC23_20555 [Halieaceae bacterium]|jgi:Flp pilus assembly protein TadD|nr:hypothetical protein [Halieaceae bacterium]
MNTNLRSWVKKLAPLLASVMMTACASAPPGLSPGDVARAKDQLLDPAHFGVSPGMNLPPAHLLEVTDEMRNFLRQHVPDSLSNTQKARRILRAILGEGLDLQYHNFRTFTAPETFHSREGNCLSFTNLFVALGREAGLKVSYQEVEVPPSWGTKNGTWLFSKHINALVKLPDKNQVVDFNLSAFDEEFPRYKLTDEAALARYYNNLGVQWMGEGDTAKAFQYFRGALQLEPDTSYFWTNLGTLYRRVGGENPRVEQAYRVAIAIDDEPVAMSNLARHYRTLGEDEKAKYYEKRVQLFRRRNPFYLFQLAQEAYEQDQYSEAKRLLQRAIYIHHDDPQFHRLLGETYKELGNIVASQRHFREASELIKNESTPL